MLQRPDSVLLLEHLGLMHTDQIGAYVGRVSYDDDIGPVAAEAFEVLEGTAAEADASDT